MRKHSSAITRFAIAVRHVWDEANRAEALLLARPWESGGELRWVREPGGLTLVGQDVPVQRAGPGRRLARRLWRRPTAGGRLPVRRPRVLRG